MSAATLCGPFGVSRWSRSATGGDRARDASALEFHQQARRLSRELNGHAPSDACEPHAV